MGLLEDGNPHWADAEAGKTAPQLIEGAKQEDAAQEYARYLERA